MRFLSLIMVALMVASCYSFEKFDDEKFSGEELSELKSKLSEREFEEITELRQRIKADPEFRREVEAQLEEKISALPRAEQKVAKKRFFGLLGLRLLANPFLFPFFGKRSVDEQTKEVMPEMTKKDLAEIKSKLSEREMAELKEVSDRIKADPEFRREVEAQLEEKISVLPQAEQKAAKKRFWGLMGLFNPFLFPFFGKRSVDEQTKEVMPEMTEEEMEEMTTTTTTTTMSPVEMKEMKEMDKTEMAKRFWGLWGLGLGYGYPFGYGLWGKKRMMSEGESDMMPSEEDKAVLEKREEEFERFLEAEKRLAPEAFKREGEMVTLEEVKEMKKRWWGLGYGYGLGLGYGFGAGYPWGFWGKRDAQFETTEKRDSFVNEEMKKINRERAYERLLKDF